MLGSLLWVNSGGQCMVGDLGWVVYGEQSMVGSLWLVIYGEKAMVCNIRWVRYGGQSMALSFLAKNAFQVLSERASYTLKSDQGWISHGAIGFSPLAILRELRFQ